MHLKNSLLFLVLGLLFNLGAKESTGAVIQPAGIKAGLSGEQRIQQLEWFANLSPAAYETLRGRKLNFIERFAFRQNQHRAKQMLKHYRWDEPTTWQKINWLIKGLLFGPIPLVLGYIFFKDDDRELIKWIWFGFAGWTAILIALLLTVA